MSYIGALAAIVLLTVWISRAETRREKIFVALLLLSINGTGVAIDSGQLILLVLPALLAGMLLLEPEDKTLGADIVAAGLLTWALMKPSVAALFFGSSYLVGNAGDPPYSCCSCMRF